VTGSCGKTTTTALTTALLGSHGTTVLGYDNAGMGLLRTVRKITAPVDFVVQETSGHAPGAMDVTLGAHRINVAVVTSVGHDHGSRFRFPDIDVPDAIALEKGRLVEAVEPGGLVCLNFDDPRVRAMASRTTQRVVGFGRADDAEIRALNVEASWPGRLHFDLIVAGRTFPVSTRFVGTLMLTNVLGALAVIHGLGFDIETAVRRLAGIEPVRDRQGVHEGQDGKTYILDTEKAPYWSTSLLIDDLPNAAIPNLTFVLGDMSDIRTNSGAQYRKLIRVLAERAAHVVLVGRAAEYGARLLEAGVDNIVVAPTAFDVSNYLDRQPPGVVILKANKDVQLHRVLERVMPPGFVTAFAAAEAPALGVVRRYEA
jgi:UDP-N-acetylmuramoyl-tripeptide--D-alanyl-D-alanine ligase